MNTTIIVHRIPILGARESISFLLRGKYLFEVDMQS